MGVRALVPGAFRPCEPLAGVGAASRGLAGVSRLEDAVGTQLQRERLDALADHSSTVRALVRPRGLGWLMVCTLLPMYAAGIIGSLIAPNASALVAVPILFAVAFVGFVVGVRTDA